MEENAYREIESILPYGQENAVSRKTLMEIFGVDERKLRRKIANERLSGALICSTTEAPGGYYRPQNREELLRFKQSMEHRARMTFAAVASVNQALKEIKE